MLNTNTAAPVQRGDVTIAEVAALPRSERSAERHFSDVAGVDALSPDPAGRDPSVPRAGSAIGSTGGTVGAMSGPSPSLEFLVGTWVGPGHGEYPTIESFDYLETVVFGTVPGRPFLTYGQRTKSPITDLPMHAETGYLRPVGGDRIELVLAHPNGIVEIEEGTLTASATGARLELRTTAVHGSSTAKTVDALVRVFDVTDDEIRYTVAMAAVGVPLTHHLAATLRRQSG